MNYYSFAIIAYVHKSEIRLNSSALVEILYNRQSDNIVNIQKYRHISAVYLISYIQRGNGIDSNTMNTAFHRTYSCQTCNKICKHSFSGLHLILNVNQKKQSDTETSSRCEQRHPPTTGGLSRDHSIRHIPFSIGGPLELSL